MFNGSRFFHLLRKWKEDDKLNYIFILKEVMNHYFDSLVGTYPKSSPLIIHNASRFSISDIAYVLSSVGYYNYSIEYCGSTNDVTVTLRNSL